MATNGSTAERSPGTRRWDVVRPPAPDRIAYQTADRRDAGQVRNNAGGRRRGYLLVGKQ